MHLTPRKAITFALVLVCLVTVHWTWAPGGTLSYSSAYNLYHRRHKQTPLNKLKWAERDADESDKYRYESTESWRTPDSFEPSYVKSTTTRPQIAPLGSYRSKGEYLKQSIVADLAYNSDKLFLMIKTGGSELWKRMPVHFFTTLTKVENFQIYSDAPGSIAGYEVIDILANVSDSVKAEFPEFQSTYRTQRLMHDEHGEYDHSEADSNMGWELDRFKNLPMLVHAYNHAPPEVEWFIMIDADTYLFMDNLMGWLENFNASEPWYIGHTISGWPSWFAHGGTGIVVSRGALDATVGQKPELDREFEGMAAHSCCGDLTLGMALYHTAKINCSSGLNLDRPLEEAWHRASSPDTRETTFQGNAPWDVQVTRNNWCLPIVSFHHLSPHDMERLYEYERLMLSRERRMNITYSDIYFDFYHDYIGERIEDWDNNARDYVFSKKDDNNEEKENPEKKHSEDPQRPYLSPDLCRTACTHYPGCVAWRWLPNDEYCGLGWSIRLGHKVHPEYRFRYDHDDYIRNTTGAISGWITDRIESIVTETRCDLPTISSDAAPSET